MAEVARSQPRPAIVFIGFMAAGKSRAAAAVAERLGAEFVDSDEVIERELDEPISAAFEREGEAEFRRREEEVVLGLLDRAGGSDAPAVIALGGGAVESQRVRDALADQLCVWCHVDEETAWERASRNEDRPLASNRDEFHARFEAREPLYESVAGAILPTNARDAARDAAPWLEALRSLPAVRMVWAASESGAYPAAVGAGALELLARARAAAAGDLPERTFCVADAAALRDHGGLLPEREATLEVEGAESSKTIAEAERVLAWLAEAGARRDDGILAFGGGVVGDLAGFCAATYQRGVPVVQAPTTLVAMVDSAYGGKTGVDLPAAKNYVGAFHLPLAVLAEPATLATLPREELAAGFAEVVKTALIAGGRLWERVRSLDSLDPADLTHEAAAGQFADVIFDCARTKIEVVASDERDTGRRAVLNLGHTVGHAVEAAGGFERYRHGEAVSLGLLAALRLSDADDLRAEVSSLLASHGLPTELDRAVALDDVLDAVGRDKKRTAEGVGFVLIERPGALRWGELVDPDRVRAAVEELYE